MGRKVGVREPNEKLKGENEAGMTDKRRERSQLGSDSISGATLTSAGRDFPPDFAILGRQQQF